MSTYERGRMLSTLLLSLLIFPGMAVADEAKREKQLKAFHAVELKPKALPTAGHIQASLGAGTRLAGISVGPMPSATGLYEAIKLDGYVRDRELLGRQLPAQALDPG